MPMHFRVTNQTGKQYALQITNTLQILNDFCITGAYPTFSVELNDLKTQLF